MEDLNAMPLYAEKKRPVIRVCKGVQVPTPNGTLEEVKSKPEMLKGVGLVGIGKRRRCKVESGGGPTEEGGGGERCRREEL